MVVNGNIGARSLTNEGRSGGLIPSGQDLDSVDTIRSITDPAPEKDLIAPRLGNRVANELARFVGEILG